MKWSLFLAAIAATCSGVVSAQTTSSPNQVITAPGSRTAPTSSGSGLLTFTNPAGGTFSIDQLDSQLRNLQASVEQALPMLTAFNNQLGGNQSLGGFLSRILPGNRSATPAQNQGGAANTATNWLAALRGLFTTNSTTAGGLDRNMLDQLATLQRDLQPVSQTLQSLNLGNAPANGAPGTIGSYPSGTNQYSGATNFNNGRLTPTGR